MVSERIAKNRLDLGDISELVLITSLRELLFRPQWTHGPCCSLGSTWPSGTGCPGCELRRGVKSPEPCADSLNSRPGSGTERLWGSGHMTGLLSLSFPTYKKKRWPSIFDLCGSDNLLVFLRPPETFIPGEEFEHRAAPLEMVGGTQHWYKGTGTRAGTRASHWLSLQFTGNKVAPCPSPIYSRTTVPLCPNPSVLQAQPTPLPPGSLSLTK